MNETLGNDDISQSVGRKFGFSHVLGNYYARHEMFFYLKEAWSRDGRGKYDVLSFISYFSFSLN